MQFTFPIQIYIDDTDCTGVVYHANYLKYYERARSASAEQLGFGIDWQRQEGIVLLVHKAEMVYLKPAKLNDELVVVSRIKECRPASIIYEQYLHFAGIPDTILNKAEFKIACVDTELRPKALPSKMKNLLSDTQTENAS
jgi:tol-pal system-associated acyl-CoA thioesterase